MLIDGWRSRLTESEYDAIVAEHASRGAEDIPAGWVGAFFGACIATALFSILRHGALEGAGPKVLLRMLAGGLAGGAVADLVVVYYTQRFSKMLAAAVIGAVAMLIIVFSILIAGAGLRLLNGEHVASGVLLASVFGAPMGLFIRDVLAWHNQIGREDELAGVRFMLNRRMRKRRISPRRQAIMTRVFPGAWRDVLKLNIPRYSTLSAAERTTLEQQIMIFVEEKKFEGCGGLEMTDEIRVTIAAFACLLTLHLDADFFPRLRSIVVYPVTYIPKTTHWSLLHEDEDPEEPDARLGESWTTGAVVLSWEGVLKSCREPQQKNLVFHEFAHQLDQEDGKADGVPLLVSVQQYQEWTSIMQREYARFRERVLAEGEVFMDAYGATNPAEFFAVATETYFERPEGMKEAHPELFRVLKDYYHQDPEGAGPARGRGGASPAEPRPVS